MVAVDVFDLRLLAVLIGGRSPSPSRVVERLVVVDDVDVGLVVPADLRHVYDVVLLGRRHLVRAQVHLQHLHVVAPYDLLVKVVVQHRLFAQLALVRSLGPG